MAESPQNFGNHVRWDPLYHFFALPVLLITVIATIVIVVMHPNLHNAWHVLLAAALFIAALKGRLYPLKAQDRIIRLEERLRLSTLLQEPLRSRIGELSESQLIGLRFASDGEIPALVEKTLKEKLEQKDIKQAIQSWRGDCFRV